VECSRPGIFGKRKTGQLDWGSAGWIWWKDSRAREWRTLEKEWLKQGNMKGSQEA
jgi:hypothetical protein